MNRLFLLIFVVIYTACTPANDDPGWPDERLSAWLDYYELSYEGFEKDQRFDRHYEVIYEHKDREDDLFAGLYIYHPDSSKAIDLDSYHLSLNKKDDGTLYSKGREPDMEVGLIIFEEEIKKRLLFCGPSCVFEEATFDPEGNIVVAGHAEDGKGYRPMLWVTSAKNDYIDIFGYTKESDLTHPASGIRYIYDIRLQEIQFHHEDKIPFDRLDVPL